MRNRSDRCNKRYCIVFIVIILLFSNYGYTQKIWIDDNGEYGARFPNEPKKINATTTAIKAYGYQCIKQYSNGGALFGFIVTISPEKITDANTKIFLEESNASFIKSLGQDPKNGKTKWGKFGDGRPKLTYELSFTNDDIPFRGIGYWIIYKGRAIRVSVSYMNTLSKKDINQAKEFLETFTILRK